MMANRALALDKLKISQAQNERVGWRSTHVVGGHLKQVEVPEHLDTSWNNIRHVNHRETNQGTTATNPQFNNSRYVFTSLARGLRWPGRAPGSPGPLLFQKQSEWIPVTPRGTHTPPTRGGDKNYRWTGRAPGSPGPLLFQKQSEWIPVTPRGTHTRLPRGEARKTKV